MKTYIPFLLSAIFVLLGCENKRISDTNEVSYMQNIDRQITEIRFMTSEVEDLFKKIPGGYTITDPRHPTMITDVANVKAGIANLKATSANLQITKANLASSEKLIQSIKQFDMSSTKLSKRMLFLTWIIVILTFIIGILAFEQLTDKWLYRKISSYRSTRTKAVESPESSERIDSEPTTGYD